MNCIFTVNINAFLRPHSRNSFIAAAQRWDCDYHEILAPVLAYPSCAKTLGAARLAAYDAVACFDADTVISTHAPNVFDLCVQPDTLYAVSDYQPQCRQDDWREVAYHKPLSACAARCSGRFGGSPKLPPMEEFFNAGFWMCQQSYAVREMMAFAYDHEPVNLDNQLAMYEEQATINLVAYNWPGIRISILSIEWNTMIAWPPFQPDPHAFVNHFGGPAHTVLWALDSSPS